MSRFHFPHKTSHPFRLRKHSISHVPTLPTIAGSRLFIDVAISLIGIFMPIFWFQLFDHSLALTLLFYSGNFLFKFPFFVPAAKLFSRFGLKTGMLTGILGYLGFFGVVYTLDTGAFTSLPLMIFLMYFSTMIITVFYWAPFHIDIIEATKKGKRGKQLGVLRAIQQILLVAAPLAGGALISTHGYHVAFLVGIALVILSTIPLKFVPRFDVNYEFTFIESYQKLFSKKYRAMTVSMMAYGAETIIGATIWPIFLFTVFKGDLLDIGGFAAFVVLIGFMLQLFIGKQTDKIPKRKLLHFGTSVYALGWLWKGLVETVTGVFAASTFHTFGGIVMRTPVDVLTYDQAADSGHYIDEYTVLREIALTMGRTIMLLFLIPFTFYFSIGSAFFIAAIVTLGVNRVLNYHAKE